MQASPSHKEHLQGRMLCSRQREAEQHVQSADDEALAHLEEECERLHSHNNHLRSALSAVHEKVTALT